VDAALQITLLVGEQIFGDFVPAGSISAASSIGAASTMGAAGSVSAAGSAGTTALICAGDHELKLAQAG
jgi:hypothetical protein